MSGCQGRRVRGGVVAHGGSAARVCVCGRPVEHGVALWRLGRLGLEPAFRPVRGPARLVQLRLLLVLWLVLPEEVVQDANFFLLFPPLFVHGVRCPLDVVVSFGRGVLPVLRRAVAGSQVATGGHSGDRRGGRLAPFWCLALLAQAGGGVLPCRQLVCGRFRCGVSPPAI